MPYDRKGVCYTNLQSVLRERGVISSNLTVTTNGRDVSQLENVLNTGLSSPLLSTSCKQKGFPLYCQFLFPPCSHGESLLLTRDKCNMLRNVYCEKEVNFVQRFRNTALYKRFSFLDPNCSTFSQQIHNSSRLYKVNSIEFFTVTRYIQTIHCKMGNELFVKPYHNPRVAIYFPTSS